MTAASSSTISNATHRQILADVQQQKEALLRQLQELEAVERFHARLAGCNGSQCAAPDAAANTARISASTTKHEAAVVALRSLGKPSKVGDIADFLLARGYGGGLSRRVFFNGLYTALKRRKDLFRQTEDASWVLIQAEQ